MSSEQTAAENGYPEKTCSIERLITHDRLIEAAINGSKTQQRRAGVYAYPGEQFALQGQQFTVTGLRQERYGDMTDATNLILFASRPRGGSRQR